MDTKLAKEIIACLPKDRTLFYYHDDKYAALLLSYAIGDAAPISEIKTTRFAKLLDRPLVKSVIAEKGDGVLSVRDLQSVCSENLEIYTLTLGLWPDAVDKYWHWNQTSRKGTNLVLQLNFTGLHDQALREALGSDKADPFTCDAHPVSSRGHNTLAWSRIDLDWERGEALVEELQTDWIRFGSFYYQQALDHLSGARSGARVRYGSHNLDARGLKDYCENVLSRHAQWWADAMLTATIWFIVEEIGIREIWMHDFRTGSRLKKITDRHPPRSLYTDLPKRFCFERRSTLPAMLEGALPKKLKASAKAGSERIWHLET